jgi:hypothetical protein
MIVYRDAMIDLTEVEVVEINWSESKEAIWVNVDGVCVLRVTKCKLLKINGEDDASKILSAAPVLVGAVRT